MAVKKTIAIVGAAATTGRHLANVLAPHPFRLLLVEKEEAISATIAQQIQLQSPAAEIDTAGCAKDGCWEADVILLAVPALQLQEVAAAIKEVATRKTVIYVASTADTNSTTVLQQALPHAQIVQLQMDVTANEYTMTGSDEEALAEATTILQQAGIQPTAKHLTTSGKTTF